MVNFDRNYHVLTDNCNTNSYTIKRNPNSRDKEPLYYTNLS